MSVYDTIFTIALKTKRRVFGRYRVQVSATSHKLEQVVGAVHSSPQRKDNFGEGGGVTNHISFFARLKSLDHCITHLGRSGDKSWRFLEMPTAVYRDALSCVHSKCIRGQGSGTSEVQNGM